LICDKCNQNVNRLKHYKNKGWLCFTCYSDVCIPESYVFKSYWDQSLGVMIDSPFKKKELEKKYGVTYMSNDERIAATKEAKRSVEAKKKYRYRKGVENIYENVQRGHSYINDLKNRGLA